MKGNISKKYNQCLHRAYLLDLVLWYKVKDGEEYIWSNTSSEYSMEAYHISYFLDDLQRNESGINYGRINGLTIQSLEA